MSNAPRAVSQAVRIDDPIDVARPFLWIAAAAFLTGFWGYMAALPMLGR
jgi:hypothetical protein